MIQRQPRSALVRPTVARHAQVSVLERTGSRKACRKRLSCLAGRREAFGDLIAIDIDLRKIREKPLRVTFFRDAASRVAEAVKNQGGTFKAGIKPSLIARQFGILQSDVRKVLASDTATRGGSVESLRIATA